MCTTNQDYLWHRLIVDFHANFADWSQRLSFHFVIAVARDCIFFHSKWFFVRLFVFFFFFDSVRNENYINVNWISDRTGLRPEHENAIFMKWLLNGAHPPMHSGNDPVYRVRCLTQTMSHRSHAAATAAQSRPRVDCIAKTVEYMEISILNSKWNDL